MSNNDPGPAGRDRAVLERFGEPTWNNPAVRFVGTDGAEIGSRLYGDWTAAGLTEHMVEALGDTAPAWLRLVAEEERGRARSEVRTLGMYCFWQGEAALGAVPGVLGARSGFVGGGEAVELRVDPERLDQTALDAAARSIGARPVAGPWRSSPADDRHALRGTPWAGLPMSEAQAARVNADVAAGQDPSRWLSPRQLAWVRAR